MTLRRWLPLICAILLLTACGKTEPAATTAPVAGTAPATMAGPRIVSTVPAATLNLVLIGAADRLVGVSKYDQIFLPEDRQNLPIVGDYETMNYETLVSLHPTAIIVQAAEPRIPARLRDVAAQYHFDIVNIKLDTVDDIWKTVAVLGKISGRDDAAAKAVADAQEDMKVMAAAMENRPRPKVVYVLERSPMSIAGGGTFMGQMVELAGGENVGTKVGGLYPTISNETLAKLAPDVLLVSAPEQAEQQENDDRLQPWMRLPIPAAWNHRIYLVTDGNAMVASLELPKQVQELAGMIHRGEVNVGGAATTEGKP